MIPAVAKPSHATLAHQVKVAPPLQPISNKLPLQVASAPQLRAKTHVTQNMEDSLNATLQERPAQRMPPVETVMLVKVGAATAGAASVPAVVAVRSRVHAPANRQPRCRHSHFVQPSPDPEPTGN